MSKDIKGLIRLRKWTVDEQRRALAELLAQEEAIIRRQRALEEMIVSEQKVAANDPTGVAARAYGDFARAAVDTRARLDGERRQIGTAIAAQQEKLAEAFRDFKTFEQIQKNRDARAAIERGRKEQAVMDETAANNFRRRREQA